MTETEKTVTPRQPEKTDNERETADFWKVFFQDLLMEQQEQA